MNPIGAQRTLRRLLYGGLASLALVCSFNASAASAGSGRAYGLQVTADVVGLGLGVPIADTGQKTAPPDFNTPTSVRNASVAAGVGNLLTVRTGVLNSATQSKLAQNSVVSSSSVSGLALKGFRLQLQLEKAQGYDGLVAILPKLREVIDAKKLRPIEAILFGSNEANTPIKPAP